jgi:hypothetical protein
MLLVLLGILLRSYFVGKVNYCGLTKVEEHEAMLLTQSR